MAATRTDSEFRRIGSYLPVPPSAIEWAISVQNAELSVGNSKPIGEILIEREQITYEVLANALELQRLDRLRQCILFADLSDRDLVWISENSTEVSLAAGQELLKQDERGDSIYALLSGRFLIYRRDEYQGDVPAGVAVPGDFLGEMDYFSYGTRSISAFAVDPALLLKTRYELLRDCDSFSKVPRAGEDLFSLPGVEPSSDSGGTDVLMERVVRRAVRVMDADRAQLYLLDRQAGDLYTTAASGNERRTFRAPAGTGIVGFVAQTGDLLSLPETYVDPRFDPAIDVWTGYWTRTLMAGPVRDAGGAIIGVLQVVNKAKGSFFNADDEVLFRAFVHQAASAVESCLPKA